MTSLEESPARNGSEQNSKVVVEIDDYVLKTDRDLDNKKLITEAVKRPKWLFYPNNKFKTSWDWIIFLLVVFNAFFIPYNISFARPNTLLTALGYIIDIIFLVDMVLTFLTAYENKRGDMVFDRKLIIVNYVKGWFIIDLVAVFPFDLIAEAAAGSSNPSTITDILKLPRLLRLARVRKVLLRAKNAHVLQLVQYTVIFFLLTHWVGCAFFLLGVSQDEGNIYIGSPWTIGLGIQRKPCRELAWSNTYMLAINESNFYEYFKVRQS